MSYKQRQFEQYASDLELLAKAAATGTSYEILNACTDLLREAAQGHARYEALRILNPREYAELWSRALLGERFDDMVDEIVRAKNES